ncbi:hypothetical protein MMC30_000659 [Trapelia coarctata]|nr:hypothetical protein [Trapelia coarctata]
MAGGAMKYRHLGRKSSHRQALLRNLVTSLFEHESISTTWPKAKEAQRLAEKLITLGKRNTQAAKNKAQGIFYKPVELMPKLFSELRERYLNRPGGYTRVLRIEPLKEDQAASAILELVDGPRDIRFAMTAKTLVRERAADEGLRPMTAKNVKKVTQFRPGGEEELERTVRALEGQERDEERRARGALKRKVYPKLNEDTGKYTSYN